MVEKIFYTLFQNKELILKLHVKLLKEKDGRVELFHQIFSYGDKEYLKLDIQSYLTLEIKDRDKNKEAWDKSKNIIIHQNNIYQIIKGMRKLISNIYNNGIFAMNKNNEVISYTDKVKDNTINLFHLGGNQRMIFTPSVIYELDGISYEGCVIAINKNSNIVQLTIDEFENLYYTLTKVDFLTYSNLLINHYMSSLNTINMKDNVKQLEIRGPSKNSNSGDTRLIKSVSDEEYFDI